MELPKLMLRRKYLLESVFFVALFSVIFLALYKPFSDTVWLAFSPQPRLFVSLCFYVVAVATLLLSKLVLYFLYAGRGMHLLTYLAWIAGEFVLIALLYIGFTLSFGMSGPDLSPGLVGRVTFCVSLILAIPYSLITLYTAYRAQKEELNLMRLQHAQQEQAKTPTSRLIHFADNNGVLRMSVDEESLYYIESQDNYVRIYYELEGKLVGYMLRCKTQTLEEILQGTSLIRCHRSYIVNVRKISCYKHSHDRAKITLQHESAKPIPVSKSYYKQVSEVVAASAPDFV